MAWRRMEVELGGEVRCLGRWKRWIRKVAYEVDWCRNRHDKEVDKEGMKFGYELRRYHDTHDIQHNEGRKSGTHVWMIRWMRIIYLSMLLSRKILPSTTYKMWGISSQNKSSGFLPFVRFVNTTIHWLPTQKKAHVIAHAWNRDLKYLWCHHHSAAYV